MNYERAIWTSLAMCCFALASNITGAEVGGHAVWFKMFAAGVLLVSGLTGIRLYDESRARRRQNIDPLQLFALDKIGLVVASCVWQLFSLHRDIIPVSIFFSVFFTATGVFFMLLMARPFITDFGVLNGFYYLSSAIAFDFFRFEWPTFLAIGTWLFIVVPVRDLYILRRRG